MSSVLGLSVIPNTQGVHVRMKVHQRQAEGEVEQSRANTILGRLDQAVPEACSSYAGP